MRWWPLCCPTAIQYTKSRSSRGMAGGYTMALPKEDRTLMARNKFLDDMAFASAGAPQKSWFSMISLLALRMISNK